ncbi:MAG: GAF domain-containing protein [Crocinitomicaceae bacterium]|jgi:L-methionine (R)-S-oxide reductase|nr:GAF domain-containing protein [Crocinitomicaceae bacterium]MDP4722730.1 GAF domain-containing protein [Crocinitomicaceae bacterium]MDP4738733.1 GAF domain-containing protein [Crocinitomicaceae bacterium]MDP4798811.1 GAF domain-containing protein [Crocinitomicaceae bacterium]MDP4806413.1 GAF domain-containing protein [Crocinitomicaceae bacterium]
MAEQLFFQSTDKLSRYAELRPQLEALIGSETDAVANMANFCAALKAAFGWFWIGFYVVREEQLVLGPFQGPIACTRIHYGKGVCGTAWAEQKSQLVPDVEAFPGHIACSALSKSELVVPIFKDQKVWGVLDIDSTTLADFDQTDQVEIEKLMTWFAGHL